MKHKLSILAALSLSLSLIACSGQQTQPVAGENEVLLAVDIKTAPEDEIRVVSYDFFTDGDIVSGGGVSNADGEPITDTIYCHVERDRDVPENADISTLEVQLYVSSDLDNTGDIYAAAAHNGESMAGSRLELNADWGSTCSIVISGNREDGYTSEIVSI